MMKNILLILLGIILILPALLLGPLTKRLPIDTERPWVDGLLINILRAYKKYNTVSWVRRLITVFKHPPVVLEYLTLLLNKQEVTYLGYYSVPVSSLSPSHYVQTSHEHHRQRVQDIKEGKIPSSSFGDLIVVNGTVHDGNHRMAAYKEAGILYIPVKLYDILA